MTTELVKPSRYRKRNSNRGAKPGERRGGRQKGTPNKATVELKAIARPYAPEAVAVLVQIMQTGKMEASRIAAARELLDRGFGRAPQSLTGEDGEGPIKVIAGWLSEHAS